MAEQRIELEAPSRGDFKSAGPGQRTVKGALLFNSLAVHPSINRRSGWTISHRATGCAMGYCGDEDRAVEAATEIERQHAAALANLDKMKFGKTAHGSRNAAVCGLERALKEMGLR